MRRQAWLAVVAALSLTLVACDDETTPTDAGADAGPSGDMDAGGDDMDAGEDMDAGGGDEDAGAGDDAGSDDAAMPDGGPDGGPLMVGECTAATIAIEPTCPAFAACPGTIAEGDYCYTGVCIEEEEILGDLRTVCAGATIESAMGMIAGQVSFLPGNEVQREVVSHVEATFVLPADMPLTNCVALLGLECHEIGPQIETRVPGSSATCALTADEAECRCDVTLDSMVDLMESYTANETTGRLMVGTGSTARTYDYCVDDADGTLQFVETTDGGGEPGIQSLAPAP